MLRVRPSRHPTLQIQPHKPIPNHTSSWSNFHRQSPTYSTTTASRALASMKLWTNTRRLRRRKWMKFRDQSLRKCLKSNTPNTNNPVFECGLSLECSMPKNINTDIYLKVFKTGTERAGEPIIVHLQDNQYFEPDCFY